MCAGLQDTSIWNLHILFLALLQFVKSSDFMCDRRKHEKNCEAEKSSDIDWAVSKVI